MAALILLNGPPAAGKSTLARLLAEARPFTLVLDIDVIRHSLGAWESDPTAAGLVARRLAIAAATTHLDDHHDVVVPQFLGRVDFISELEACARATNAKFFDMLLTLDPAEATEAFADRRLNSDDPIHVDAAALVPLDSQDEVLGQLAEQLEGLYSTRPGAIRIPVTRGDEQATFNHLVAGIEAAGLRW